MEANREKLLDKAKKMQSAASEIINETQVVKAWENIGAQINLVGSAAMGLMMEHRDIDFHIYTDPFRLSDSFKAIATLAEHPRIRSLTYTNLIDAEDRCIEWHAQYQDEQDAMWQIDMIHILKDSFYAGYFEKVAARINEVMTEEKRIAILAIKDAAPADRKVMGIRVYRAVIEDGITDWLSFEKWEQAHPITGIEKWMP